VEFRRCFHSQPSAAAIAEAGLLDGGGLCSVPRSCFTEPELPGRFAIQTSRDDQQRKGCFRDLLEAVGSEDTFIELNLLFSESGVAVLEARFPLR